MKRREQAHAIVLNVSGPAETSVAQALYTKSHQLPIVVIADTSRTVDFAQKNGMRHLNKAFTVDGLRGALNKGFEIHAAGKSQGQSIVR
jgi:hypothetical protein